MFSSPFSFDFHVNTAGVKVKYDVIVSETLPYMNNVILPTFDDMYYYESYQNVQAGSTTKSRKATWRNITSYLTVGSGHFNEIHLVLEPST